MSIRMALPAPVEPERDLEGAAFDVLEHGVRVAGQSTEQMAGPGDHRLARHQRRVELGHDRSAPAMVPLTPVEERHDAAGVQQHRPHDRPNPRRCFLFEPRSADTEANRPTPTIRWRRSRGRSAS
jgi:hypothetical protein